MLVAQNFPQPEAEVSSVGNLPLSTEVVQQNLESVRQTVLSDFELTTRIIASLKEAIEIAKRVDNKHGTSFYPAYYTERMAKKLVRLFNGLKIFSIHFEFLSEIINASAESDIPEIINKFRPVSRHYRPFSSKADICLFTLNECFEKVIFLLLQEVEKTSDKFLSLEENHVKEMGDNPESLLEVQIVTSKLMITLDYFPEAVALPSGDIFSQPRTSEVWKKIYENAEFITIASKEEIKNQFKILNKIFKIANAMIYKSQEKEPKTFLDKAHIALSGIYYGAKAKKAELMSSLFLADPKMETAFLLWNFNEKGWAKELMKLALPTMDYDRRIHVHRLFPAITRERILKEYQEGTLNKIIESTFKPADLTSKKEIILESIFTKQADAVSIRIISPFPLVLKGNHREKARAMTMKAVNTVTKILKKGRSTNSDSEPDDEIIFHIHGGGFTAGSSSSHRNYLYRWAKSMNKIIFSVDYRLAPDYPYPAGLDDVWQAYNWVVNYAEPLLGIKTKRIVLAGDSAGGNLVTALTLWAIKNGVRVPDGCFLCYPALNIFSKRLSPSYFLAIEDIILPYSLLNLCVKAYVTEEFKADTDPFLSPVVAEDSLLARMPPVRIVTGTDDPLHDDNWRFLVKMQALNKDIKVTVLNHLPHAFLSLDQVDDYKNIIEISCRVMSELFTNNSLESVTFGDRFKVNQQTQKLTFDI